MEEESGSIWITALRVSLIEERGMELFEIVFEKIPEALCGPFLNRLIGTSTVKDVVWPDIVPFPSGELKAQVQVIVGQGQNFILPIFLENLVFGELTLANVVLRLVAYDKGTSFDVDFNFEPGYGNPQLQELQSELYNEATKLQKEYFIARICAGWEPAQDADTTTFSRVLDEVE